MALEKAVEHEAAAEDFVNWFNLGFSALSLDHRKKAFTYVRRKGGEGGREFERRV